MKKRIFSLVLLSLLIFTVVSCGGNDGTSSGILTLSLQEVDKVFNPFFSSSAPDSEVVSYTQISMLTNDADGNVACGEDEPVVVLDYEIKDNGLTDDELETTYYFVLKNNVKFSNGSPLTIRDVFFNLYVYLDPVYSGSSTIYSTDIKGLDEYRTQSADEKEQDKFMEQFYDEAERRIDAFVDASYEIIDDANGSYLTKEEFVDSLSAYIEDPGYENVLNDYNRICELFREELETDYQNSLDSYSSITFTNSNGAIIENLFTTDVEAFLYNEGYLDYSKESDKLIFEFDNNPTTAKYWTKEQAIDAIYNDMIPNRIIEVALYWATASNIYEELVNEALSDYAETVDMIFPEIEGIQFANRVDAVTVNGNSYEAPVYAEDGSVSNDTNEVLAITINGVDPKAIWNFSFAVAPMYYYSDEEHINEFSFENHKYGVEYSSIEFMNNVVKDPAKVDLPVGAGMYQISDDEGNIGDVSNGDFYSNGVIYYKANPHFVLGAPSIEQLRLQVVPQNNLLNTLYTNAVDFVAPNAKPKTIAELQAKKKDGIGFETIQTSGYGYIGINAGKVPAIAVRQAIMHSIDTESLTTEYYGNTATTIYRSMSKSSWAYPKEATAYYPYIGGAVPEDLSVVNPLYAEFCQRNGYSGGMIMTEEDQAKFLKMLVEDEAGYSIGGQGYYVNDDSSLKLTFTIAGDSTDHPAYLALQKAANRLNEIGFAITVSNDARALSKLTTGDLAVWAAAWSSTIDPDMYQVYHIDSKATSVNNWGYKQIKQNIGGKYDVELALIEELSEIIDAARETNNQSERAQLYAEALDIVMELAIELPTYQRDDLFAYNTNTIDESTLNKNTSPFKGLLSNLWQVKLNTTK